MRSTECAAHKHDSLVPVEDHHVWPLGYHGPNTKANKVRLCANAHGDAHYLLERLLKTGDDVPWPELRAYGPGVRRLAFLGYDKVTAYAEQLAGELTPPP